MLNSGKFSDSILEIAFKQRTIICPLQTLLECTKKTTENNEPV